MIHITELRLPIDHTPQDLEVAILERLGISASELLGVEIFKRSYDARKKAALSFTYIVDVSVKDPSAVLKRHKEDARITPTPDTGYHYVAQA